MAYKALISFSGLVTMRRGEVKEISDADIAKDLLKAGYITEIKPAEKVKAETVKEDKKPVRAKKRG